MDVVYRQKKKMNSKKTKKQTKETLQSDISFEY